MPFDVSPPQQSGRRLRLIVVLMILTALVGLTTIVLVDPEILTGRRGPVYVGDLACASCHQEQAALYEQTAHALTSALASTDTVHGSFRVGTDIFQTGNPGLHYKMEAKDGALFQTAVISTSSPDQVLTRTERMDLVIGSGRKGQTYLYWDGNRLYQLPISFWTEQGTWVNSPGYIDGRASFDRGISPRCLECHGSSFVSLAPPLNAYEKSSLVLGISCEKCHGPGSEHVARYQSASPPQSTADAAILNPARLTRDRQTDLCALCHAGYGDAHTPALSYRPGDVLADHFSFPRQESGIHIDVHASQVQLMERSRCFQASPTMSCITCHDVHQPQRDLMAMASRCLQCHQPEECGEFPRRNHAIDTQCITCHMPLEQTAQIVIADRAAPTMQPQVRNHQIAIYPDIEPTDE